MRSISLPANYSDIDLVSISASNRYTYEELQFNKLWVLVTQADNRLRNRINAAKRELEPYGITKAEIETLVNEKIQQRIEAEENSFNIQKELQSKIAK